MNKQMREYTTKLVFPEYDSWVESYQIFSDMYDILMANFDKNRVKTKDCACSIRDVETKHDGVYISLRIILPPTEQAKLEIFTGNSPIFGNIESFKLYDEKKEDIIRYMFAGIRSLISQRKKTFNQVLDKNQQ